MLILGMRHATRGFIRAHIGLWLIRHVNGGGVTGQVARRRVSDVNWETITVALVLPFRPCAVGVAFLSTLKGHMHGVPLN